MLDQPHTLLTVLTPDHLPLWLKITYTLFVCLLVPINWVQYGPGNYLWFSDIAVFITVPALWLESSLLASMMALAVVLLEVGWNADYFCRLITGVSLSGISAYMFDPTIALIIRAISLFHIALPIILLWMMYRLGYDHRAFIAQTLLAWIVLPLTYLLTKPSENINRVYGWGENPQTRMPGPLYLLIVMILFPLLIYLPSHLMFKAIFH